MYNAVESGVIFAGMCRRRRTTSRYTRRGIRNVGLSAKVTFDNGRRSLRVVTDADVAVCVDVTVCLGADVFVVVYSCFAFVVVLTLLLLSVVFVVFGSCFRSSFYRWFVVVL